MILLYIQSVTPRFVLVLSTWVIKHVPSASVKIETSKFLRVVSMWHVEDSKIDFKNENTAHGNRLLLVY